MSQQITMPKDYVVCTATEGSCPIREKCLRSKVHRETDYTSPRYNRSLSVVNLWNSAVKPLTNECEMYRATDTRSFARGFKHLFDKVAKGVYGDVQRQVLNVFTSERTYYYCKNGTYLTSPEEQRKIAEIFKRHGLPQPTYDKYVETFDWS